MTDDQLAMVAVFGSLLLLAALVAAFLWGDKQHWWSRWWARWFHQRPGGTLLLVPIGTFGIREALRMVTTFAAAGATREILAVVMLDFHQEVYEYAEAFRKVLGPKRVIVPSNMPPGSSQGFMHKTDHPRRTREAWGRELKRMATRARQLHSANGSTTTTVCYILPPWSGHFPIGNAAVAEFKQLFLAPILHVGRLNLLANNEPKLIANMRDHPEYPDCLGLDGILVADQSLNRTRANDWPIAAGIAGLFAANKVDPSQQHGANPLQDLVHFARGSGGYIGLGVGQSTVPLIPTSPIRSPLIAEQELSMDVANTITDALTHKAWSAPDPSIDSAQFMSVVVPLDSAHPQWHQNALRREALEDIPTVNALPEGCQPIWTYAAIDNGTKDTATIFALWLYPVHGRAPVVGGEATGEGNGSLENVVGAARSD